MFLFHILGLLMHVSVSGKSSEHLLNVEEFYVITVLLTLMTIYQVTKTRSMPKPPIKLKEMICINQVFFPTKRNVIGIPGWEPAQFGQWLGFLKDKIKFQFQIPERKTEKIKSYILFFFFLLNKVAFSYREIAGLIISMTLADVGPIARLFTGKCFMV